MIDVERMLARASRRQAARALIDRLPLRWPRSSRVYEGDLRCAGDRRYAIVSTITDNFVGLGAVFLLSLHERLANRADVDVILVQAKDVAPLSQGYREALTRLCPGLRVLDIDVSFLTPDNMTRYDRDGKPFSVGKDRNILPSKRAAYVKLNVLRFTQYERVLLMDSDLMIVDDFSELFAIEEDVAAVRSGARIDGAVHRRAPRWSGRGSFNSGVLLLSRRCRGERPFNAAIDFMNEKRDRPLRDQSVLNHLFRRAGKTLLPNAYNYKLSISDPDMLNDPAALETAKIIHFVGTSKWALSDERNRGKPIYDRFHEIQARTGVPFVLEG